MKIETAGMLLKDLQTAPRVSAACDALVEVQKIVKKDGAVVLILSILAATLMSQIGRIQAEYLNLPVSGNDTAQELEKRILKFAMAFGLITVDQFESGVVNFEFEQFVGQRAIVQIVSRKNQPLQVGFLDVWAVDDSAAPFVPTTIDEKGDDK